MNPDIREAAIQTITRYHATTRDHLLLEMAGYGSSHATTAEMDRAVVAAVLPLLPDEELMVLVFHVAEALVSRDEEVADEAA